VGGWKAGDRISVPATADQYSSGQKPPTETEERIVQAIGDAQLTFSAPLEFEHQAEGSTRGEVANLSRSVVVESADPKGERGHTMYHEHSAGAISYAEFRHLDKKGHLGRYPLHYHLVGDTMHGSFVIGASVKDSANRWLTENWMHFKLRSRSALPLRETNRSRVSPVHRRHVRAEARSRGGRTRHSSHRRRPGQLAPDRRRRRPADRLGTLERLRQRPAERARPVGVPDTPPERVAGPPRGCRPRRPAPRLGIPETARTEVRPARTRTCDPGDQVSGGTDRSGRPVPRASCGWVRSGLQ